MTQMGTRESESARSIVQHRCSGCTNRVRPGQGFRWLHGVLWHAGCLALRQVAQGGRTVIRVTRAEIGEASAASACPFCGARPVSRDYSRGMWSCSNCDESGTLSWRPGTRPRDTAIPDPIEPR